MRRGKGRSPSLGPYCLSLLLLLGPKRRSGKVSPTGSYTTVVARGEFNRKGKRSQGGKFDWGLFGELRRSCGYRIVQPLYCGNFCKLKVGDGRKRIGMLVEVKVLLHYDDRGSSSSVCSFELLPQGGGKGTNLQF